MTLLNDRERALIAQIRHVCGDAPSTIPVRLVAIAERADVLDEISPEDAAFVDLVRVRPGLDAGTQTLVAVLQGVRIQLLERRLARLEMKHDFAQFGKS